MLACHMRFRGIDAILQGMDFGLPDKVLKIVRTSKPLLKLMAAVGRSYKSDYNDGDDEPAYSTSTSNSAEGKANSGDGGSSSSVSDDLLNVFQNAFENPATAYKKRKSEGGSSIPTSPIQFVKVLHVRVYNKDLKIYPGAFFGLLGERLGVRKYASVTECFEYAADGKEYVRLRIYTKKNQLSNRDNMQELVKGLGLPFLTPTDTYTFRSAAELKYPLHVLHACHDDCSKNFAFGNQSTEHNVAKYPLHVLSTYHVGTVNF